MTTWQLDNIQASQAKPERPRATPVYPPRRRFNRPPAPWSRAEEWALGEKAFASQDSFKVLVGHGFQLALRSRWPNVAVPDNVSEARDMKSGALAEAYLAVTSKPLHERVQTTASRAQGRAQDASQMVGVSGNIA